MVQQLLVVDLRGHQKKDILKLVKRQGQVVYKDLEVMMCLQKTLNLRLKILNLGK
jgi:hypothetical protein